MKFKAGKWIALICAGLIAFPVASDEPFQKIGPSTGLPIPRYISLNSSEANMRRGPSQDYPIEWVYHRAGYPMRVIGESGHWRKVEDPDGARGWFHYALLSGNRTALITADKVTLNKSPAENSQLVAILQKGVIASLNACTSNWCEIEIQKLEGWVPKTAIWGVSVEETFGQ